MLKFESIYILHSHMPCSRASCYVINHNVIILAQKHASEQNSLFIQNEPLMKNCDFIGLLYHNTVCFTSKYSSFLKLWNAVGCVELWKKVLHQKKFCRRYFHEIIMNLDRSDIFLTFYFWTCNLIREIHENKKKTKFAKLSINAANDLSAVQMQWNILLNGCCKLHY